MDYTIDAKGKRLGRVASEISMILQGKKSPAYEPRLVSNNRVLVKNYQAITVGGGKETKKVYHRHTGYVGGIKSKTYSEAMEKDPKWALRHAVRKMLPRNFLNQKRMKNLIFLEK